MRARPSHKDGRRLAIVHPPEVPEPEEFPRALIVVACQDITGQRGQPVVMVAGSSGCAVGHGSYFLLGHIAAATALLLSHARLFAMPPRPQRESAFSAKPCQR